MLKLCLLCFKSSWSLHLLDRICFDWCWEIWQMGQSVSKFLVSTWNSKEVQSFVLCLDILVSKCNIILWKIDSLPSELRGWAVCICTLYESICFQDTALLHIFTLQCSCCIRMISHACQQVHRHVQYWRKAIMLWTSADRLTVIKNGCYINFQNSWLFGCWIDWGCQQWSCAIAVALFVFKPFIAMLSFFIWLCVI